MRQTGTAKLTEVLLLVLLCSCLGELYITLLLLLLMAGQLWPLALAACDSSGKQRYTHTRIISSLCFTMSNQGNRIYVGNLDTRITERDLEVWRLSAAPATPSVAGVETGPASVAGAG